MYITEILLTKLNGVIKNWNLKLFFI